MNLSVVISAYNEEEKIEDCLKSVKFASEIIVIDNSSQDKTLSLAKKYTKNVYKRENNKMLNVNKNFGISKANHDWVLVLDADERVSEDLKNEIQKKIEAQTSDEAYKIPRKNIIFGKWIQHTGWYPDYQIRLFKKSKGKFAQVHNHEQLSVEGHVGTLQQDLIHYNYDSIAHFLQKMLSTYTDDQVKKLQKDGYKFKHSHIISRPFQEFLSRYFARQGHKDGFHGLVLALLQAFDHLIVVLKLWEKEKYPVMTQKEVQQMLKTEIHTSQKEAKHWASEVKMKEMNPIRQTIERAKRKFA